MLLINKIFQTASVSCVPEFDQLQEGRHTHIFASRAWSSGDACFPICFENICSWGLFMRLHVQRCQRPMLREGGYVVFTPFWAFFFLFFSFMLLHSSFETMPWL